MSERQPQIQGEPLSVEDLIELVGINNLNRLDLEEAAEWWDETASANFVGALDSEPIDDNTDI